VAILGHHAGMTNPAYRHGQFVWREMMTTDVDATLRFYGEVFGWKHKTVQMPDGTDYHMLSMGDVPVCGAMKLPMPNVPAHWVMSVSVADVDATAARITGGGGQVHVPPMDAGGMGRYALVADPQGAVFSIWRSNSGDGERAADWRPGVGEFCWEQLNTSDPKAAREFYTNVLGWTEEAFAGGGGMNVYKSGDAQVASSMQAPPGVPAHWLTYVVVDTLTNANARVAKNGGKVMVEKIEIPTVGSISVVQDNVGAVIGLFEVPKNSQERQA
jgi:predicted enzyme related to lactoylglutathione lyase